LNKISKLDKSYFYEGSIKLVDVLTPGGRDAEEVKKLWLLEI
jgi:hypothetical protein